MFNLRFPALFAALAIVGLTFTQCSTESVNPDSSVGAKSNNGSLVAAQEKLDTPTLSLATKGMASLVVRICAGATGAEGGFSLQWMKKSDFVANGNEWSDNTPSFCSLSISGSANSSRYAVGPNGCVDVRIGEILMDNGAGPSCNAPLECGTEYVVRVFAKNVPGRNGLNKSDWSETLTAATWNCEIKPGMMCTRTAGEWKANPMSWPVSSLTIGTVSYTKVELLSILNTEPANNGLIALAHQVIAAKLNVAAGSPSSYVWHPLMVVDGMIGSTVIPPVGGGSMDYATVNERMNYLWNYNDGAVGPGHCF